MKKYVLAALIAVAMLAGLTNPSGAAEALPPKTGICQRFETRTDGEEVLGPLVLLEQDMATYFFQDDDSGRICQNLNSGHTHRWLGRCESTQFEGNDPCAADSGARVVTMGDVENAESGNDSSCLTKYNSWREFYWTEDECLFEGAGTACIQNSLYRSQDLFACD